MSYAKRMFILDNTALKYSLLGGTSRRMWVHPINEERTGFGEYHHLVPQLRCDPNKFKDYFRMSPETFDYILAHVSPYIEKKTTNLRKPISPEERLSVTLRFLATGLSFRGLSFEFRMGESTVASIVVETCEALWQVLQPLHMPVPNENICKKVEEGFRTKWNFPHCFGCIDGKHVRVTCPDKSGSQFYNYKQYFSIILQGLADGNCKFITIDVGATGKQSDGGVFRNSDLYLCLESNAFNVPTAVNLPNTNIKTPFVILGDEAYPLLNYLMRPFPRASLDHSKKIFNYRLSRARRCMECAFGLMCQKFRILHKSIDTKTESAVTIVKAICVLHNTIIDREGIDHTLADDSSHNNVNMPSLNRDSSNSRQIAQSTRNKFKDYFVSEDGSVPWQNFIL